MFNNSVRIVVGRERLKVKRNANMGQGFISTELQLLCCHISRSFESHDHWKEDVRKTQVRATAINLPLFGVNFSKPGIN